MNTINLQTISNKHAWIIILDTLKLVRYNNYSGVL